MVGRSEDGSGSVKVRISWGDTKPLKRSHPPKQVGSILTPTLTSMPDLLETQHER